MTKSVSEKMGIEQNARSIFINAPEDTVKAIKLPDINLEKKLAGHFLNEMQKNLKYQS